MKFTGVFAIVIGIAAFWAMKFSRHPIAWLIGLTAAIPIFAAIAGGLKQSNKKAD